MTNLDGRVEQVTEYHTEKFVDERGTLTETFSRHNGFDISKFDIQLELEVSSKKGVVRGFHYQTGENAQAKLVRVLNGKILDAVVDIRQGSSTFGVCSWRVLEENDGKVLYIPRGFAHAYQVLIDSKILYKLDAPYDPASSRGIRYDDPHFEIPWDRSVPAIMSITDQNYPLLKEAF
jgi:dTDP-4-dehydrorhamnose 3,5-epimerase